MTKEERRQARQTKWELPKTEQSALVNPHAERDAAIAQLVGTPGWEALKSLMQSIAPFHVPKTDEANFEIRLHESVFRSQFVVQIIRAVEVAAARDKQPKATA